MTTAFTFVLVLLFFSDTPTGTLPYLDVNGIKIAQSGAINAYIAAEHGKFTRTSKILKSFKIVIWFQ